MGVARKCQSPSCNYLCWSACCCQLGVTSFGPFEVEVIDPVADYLASLKEVFDFGMLRQFVSRSDFSMVFDAMHAVTGRLAPS